MLFYCKHCGEIFVDFDYEEYAPCPYCNRTSIEIDYHFIENHLKDFLLDNMSVIYLWVEEKNDYILITDFDKFDFDGDYELVDYNWNIENGELVELELYIGDNNEDFDDSITKDISNPVQLIGAQ